MQINQLGTRGFVSGPYDKVLRVVVGQAMDSWKDFCGLKQKDKDRLSLGDRTNDIGYSLRGSDKINADPKEFFHVSFEHIDRLRTASVVKRLGEESTTFITCLDGLMQGVRPLIRDFTREVGAKYHLPHLERDSMAQSITWVFRFIHYFPRTGNSGGVLAHSHADRGGFTLHLSESHPGAEYLSLDQQTWKPLPVSEAETVIFPSMALQYYSRSRLNALCHRVLATPETAREGRFSMVLFVNIKMEKRYNDIYRLQDFAPGFNYGMPMESLEKFFTTA